MLGHVGVAADAARHLTTPVICDLLAEVSRACPAHGTVLAGPGEKTQEDAPPLVDPCLRTLDWCAFVGGSGLEDPS